MNPSEVKFTGQTQTDLNCTLLDFWRWAFSDLCDDDIKGVFAEWMVRALLGLPVTSGRRVSWADSDIVTNGLGIEIKSTALLQSWKLVNADGTRKSGLKPATLDPHKVRFAGLQARTAESPAKPDELRGFKSNFYVFCFQSETDPDRWDAWNLAQWEFYLMSRQELVDLKVGGSISLATLRKVRLPMSAEQLQSCAKARIGSLESDVKAESTKATAASGQL